MAEESKMLPRGLEFDLSDMTQNPPTVTKIKVFPIPLRAWKDLVLKVAELIDLADIQALTGDASDPGAFKAAFARLQDAPDKIAELCSLATPATKDQVLNADFEQAFGLLMVVLQVNNVAKVLKDAIKKVKARESEA